MVRVLAVICLVYLASCKKNESSSSGNMAPPDDSLPVGRFFISDTLKPVSGIRAFTRNGEVLDTAALGRLKKSISKWESGQKWKGVTGIISDAAMYMMEESSMFLRSGYYTIRLQKDSIYFHAKDTVAKYMHYTDSLFRIFADNRDSVYGNKRFISLPAHYKNGALQVYWVLGFQGSNRYPWLVNGILKSKPPMVDYHDTLIFRQAVVTYRMQ